MDPKEEEIIRENERLKEELSQLKQRDAAARSVGRKRIRGTVSGILIVLTALSLVASTVGVWTNRTLWNQDKFMSRVAPVIQEPAVRNAMAVELTDQVFAALDVQNRVQEALSALSTNTDVPEQVTFLAGPISQGMYDLVRTKVDEFLASDTFYRYWEGTLAALHPKVVALLKGDYSQLPNVSVESGGEVQLNLVPIVAQILKDLVQQGLGALDINLSIPEIPADAPVDEAVALLSSKLGVQLPPDFGQVTLMTENQLTSLQSAANALRLLTWGLLLLTLLLAMAAIAVAPNHRLALGLLGVGSALGVLLGFAALRNVKNAILDSIEPGEIRKAAGEVFTTLGGDLRYTAKWIFWVSIIVALIALVLTRRPVLDLMTRIGRSFGGSGSEMGAARSWAADHSSAAYGWSTGVAIVALFIAGISMLSLLIIGAALAVALMWVTASQNEVSKA